MNILITGAAGFLGSHLAARYLAHGHLVVGIDNFSSSQRGSDHLNELIKQGVYFLEGDICNTPAFRELSAPPPSMKFDLILNFACPASPPRYQDIPVETLMTCTLGLKNVLELAEDQRNGCVVVHASTSEVYGDPEISPQSEFYRGNVNSYGPRSCYDEGKRAGEALCYDYKHKYGVDARVIRIFNTYGPNMDMYDGRVVSNFICQALRGEDITVYGDGSQTRSFCYVDDLVDGITAVAGLPKGKLAGPVNLGNPHEFTVAQLAQLVLEKLPEKGSKLINKTLPVDDPTQRKPNIFKAQELFGFEPKVSLSEGLDKTIAYFRTQLS